MRHSLLLFFRGLFIINKSTCCDVLFAGDRYHIGRNLYLIHLKSMDLAAFLCPGLGLITQNFTTKFRPTFGYIKIQ